MKFLHTADWHLGKRLNFYSRLEEQILVMQEICDIANEQNVDMVIVAGDIFDTFNPTTEAIELLYKTLKKLTKNGTRPVIAIAGNHDSPNRIDAPDALARACGILMIGHPNAEVTPFENSNFSISKTDKGFLEIKLNKYTYPIRVLHTPYANETRLKQYLGDDNKEQKLNEILQENWHQLSQKYCDNTGVNLLTAHLYMMKKGSEVIDEPDGEKPLKVGNADMVFAQIVPDEIQYTALGHLHGYMNIGTENKPVVYASSPLCYSFSEAGQEKFVVVVEAIPNQTISKEKIALTSGKKLIRKTFDCIDTAEKWLLENPDCLLELTLESDTFLTAEERNRIIKAHQGIIHLIPKVKNVSAPSSDIKNIDLGRDMNELFKDYFKHKNNGQETTEEIMQLFNEIKNA